MGTVDGGEEGEENERGNVGGRHAYSFVMIRHGVVHTGSFLNRIAVLADSYAIHVTCHSKRLPVFTSDVKRVELC